MTPNDESSGIITHKRMHTSSEAPAITTAALKEANSLHRQAMNLVEQAFVAKSKGKQSEVQAFIEEAYILELLAANLVSAYDIEPTRSVLHRSAATMAVDCGQFNNAVRLVLRGLQADPPVEIAHELKEVLERVPESIRSAITTEEALTPPPAVGGSELSSRMFEIVGVSAALRAVLMLVAKISLTESTVLITGESGTGKELIARTIHNWSRRSARPFVSTNCAVIPESLINSELFGIEKGVLTGGVHQQQGRFELAEGGTIFLDEIQELPPETQILLLRTIQEREFERVGGNQKISANVRMIAATNSGLEAAVAEGTFRADLFYRLNVFRLKVPPLRERKEDIQVLAEYFTNYFSRMIGKTVTGVSKDTLGLLQSYTWPGNIRELQNVIERAVILCETADLSIDKQSFLKRFATVHAHERKMIEAALAKSKGRVSGPLGAAARLGLSRSALESRIRSLAIDKSRFKTD